MMQLLRLEFRRLLRLKSLYICTGIMLAMVFLSALSTQMLLSLSGDLLANYLGSSGIAALLRAFLDSSYELLIAIFVALSVCEDFEQKTIRVIMSRGHSRKRIFFAKLLTISIFSTLIFMLVQLVSFGAGSLFFGVGQVVTDRLPTILIAQYVTCLAEVTMFFGISYLLRKNGASLAVTIVIPVVVQLVLTLVDISANLGEGSLSEYWISGNWNSLTYQTVSVEKVTTCLIIAGIYWLIFIGVGLFSAEKREV